MSDERSQEPEASAEEPGQDLDQLDSVLDADQGEGPGEVDAGEAFLDLDQLENSIKEDLAAGREDALTRRRFYLDPETRDWVAW